MTQRRQNERQWSAAVKGHYSGTCIYSVYRLLTAQSGSLAFRACLQRRMMIGRHILTPPERPPILLQRLELPLSALLKDFPLTALIAPGSWPLMVSARCLPALV